MRISGVWAALLLVAGSARAQGQDGASSKQSAQGTGKQPAGRTSDAFDRACIDLLHGRMPQGDQAIKELKDACANVMAGRANEGIQAEKQLREQAAAREALRLQAQAKVQPGQATAQVGEGEGVLAAFGSATSEMTGKTPKAGMGMRRKNPVGYTLVTNPFGYFTGLGVNAEIYGAFPDAPKFSWVGGVRYSMTDLTTGDGNATTFGVMGGADWFIIGKHNEGLRLGPRLELAAGSERVSGNTSTFTRLGLAGELGYNFIATNGITGLLAIGVGGRVAGDSVADQSTSFVGGEFGPYISAGLGYSW